MSLLVLDLLPLSPYEEFMILLKYTSFKYVLAAALIIILVAVFFIVRTVRKKNK